MLYAPENPQLGLWDTWLVHGRGEWHLFYLKRDLRDTWAKAIGHATSPDLIRWRSAEDAVVASEAPAWDSGWFMTGTVVEHGGRYYLFYGSMVDQVQRIGVAISDDLYTWHKHGTAPVIVPTAPYETDPTVAPNHETAWRDPCIVWDDATQHYYAFICARMPGGNFTGGGCIAVCRSADLLVWETLPPAYISETCVCLEVPDVFALDGRYYLMYSTSRGFNTYYPTSDPHMVNGTFYLESDHLLSGYQPPDGDNAVIGSREHRLDSYVGRSVAHPSDGTRLFYHHMVRHEFPKPQGVGSFGLVQRLAVSPERGRLQVRYRPELEAFANPVAVKSPSLMLGRGRWTLAEDRYQTQPDQPSAVLFCNVEALIATVRVQFAAASTGAAGLIIGYGAAPEQGVVIALNSDTHTIELGLVSAFDDGIRLRRDPPIQSRRCALDAGRAYVIRVVLNQHYLDVFLDDVFLIAFSWQKRLYGQIGLFAQDAAVTFDQMTIQALAIPPYIQRRS
jgi:beta-fructofuranosidase